MVKMIELEGYGVSYSQLIVGSKILIGKLQSEGLQFAITGIGLRKAERELLGYKKFKINGPISLYIGKLIFTYDKKGYMHHIRKMNIVNELKLI